MLALVPFVLVNLNFPESFTGYALASAFVIHVIIGQRSWEWFCAVLLGVLLNAAARWVASWWHLPGVAPLFSLAMLGAGSLLVLGWHSSWSVEPDTKESRSAFLQSVVLLVLVLASQLMLGATRVRGLYVFDSYLAIFDEALGWKSLFAQAFVARVSFLHHFAVVAYDALPVIAAIVCAAYSRDRNAPDWQLLKVVVVAAVLGYGVYLIFPAVGPRYIENGALLGSSGTPASLRALHPFLLQVPVGVARNAMPSLHMVWALLICLEARKLPLGFQTIAFLYAILTPFVVLVMAEHYLIDLIVAIPFALMVEAICVDGQRFPALDRWRAGIAGCLMVTAWLFLLRFETPNVLFSPIASWSCVILSTAISAVMIRQLFRLRSDDRKSLDPVENPVLRAAASEGGSLTNL
jgi:hypothetical protein